MTWGLNLRSSMDTSNAANILGALPAGTKLLLIESDGYSRVGAINQMLRVREPGGKEGYAAAWYLEKVDPIPPPPPPSDKVYARVMASVTAGLNVRSSTDTSSLANLVATVPAGTQLELIEANANSKVGVNGQWVRVRTPQGQEGFAAAWYLEKVRLP